MNNNELRASLLMEAADLLDESAGRHGKKSKELAKEAARKGTPGWTMPAFDAAMKHSSAIRDVVKQKSRIRETQKHPDSRFMASRLEKRCPNISRAKIKAWTDDPYLSHDQIINKRGEREKALKESIDLLYDKAALCESAEDTEYYINQALELSELL